MKRFHNSGPDLPDMSGGGATTTTDDIGPGNYQLSDMGRHIAG